MQSLNGMRLIFYSDSVHASINKITLIGMLICVRMNLMNLKRFVVSLFCVSSILFSTNLTAIDTTVDSALTPERLLSFCEDAGVRNSDNKCGYMNTQGKVVIPAIYNRRLSRMPEFEGNVVFLNKDTKLGAINRKGEVILPFNYSDIENFTNYSGQPRVTDVKLLSGGYRGSKLGLVSERGELLCEPEIESDHQRRGIGFYNDYAIVVKHIEVAGLEVKRSGLMNKACEMVLPYEYNQMRHYGEGLVPVQKKGLWGYVDLEGKVVIDFDYTTAGTFTNGVAVVTLAKRDDEAYKFLLIDMKGKTLKEIDTKKYDWVSPRKNGMYSYGKDRKMGLLNEKFEVITEPVYRYIFDFKDGLAEIKRNEKKGYINEKGEEVVKPEYDGFNRFEEGMLDASIDGEDGYYDLKVGYVDRTGKVVVPLVYDYGVYFSDGLSAVAKGDVSAGEAKWGFIDKTGVEVIPLQYDLTISFSKTDHLAAVKKDEKWGFINKQGEEIIPLIYKEVGRFSDGYAWVKFENKEGRYKQYQINTKGEPVGFSLSDMK